MSDKSFSEKVAAFCFATMGALIMLALVGAVMGTCSGSDRQTQNTEDYVREHGLPPDPNDRTPAR